MSYFFGYAISLADQGYTWTPNLVHWVPQEVGALIPNFVCINVRLALMTTMWSPKMITTQKAMPPRGDPPYHVVATKFCHDL